MALILIGLSLYTLYRVVRRVPPAVLDDDAALRIAQLHAAVRAHSEREMGAASSSSQQQNGSNAAAPPTRNGDDTVETTADQDTTAGPRAIEDPGAALRTSAAVLALGSDDGGATFTPTSPADDFRASLPTSTTMLVPAASAPTSLVSLDGSAPSTVPIGDAEATPPTETHPRQPAQPLPALAPPTHARPSPDLLAAVLAGEAGEQLLSEAAPQLVEDYGDARTRLLRAGLQRTLALDAHWMAAHNARGIRQFVILGAGLDTRPWRLPHIDATAKVFEVDTPAMHAYKSERLAAAASASAGTLCTRIVVEAPPLITPAWAEALLAAGFIPTEPSFFLCESVLMFLEPASVRKLLRIVVKLMCPGSVVAGDMVLGGSRFQPAYLKRWSAPWMSDVVSTEAAAKLLVGLGLQRRPALETVILDSDVVGSGSPVRDDTADQVLVARLRSEILNLEGWPATTADWWIDRVIAEGDTGVRAVVKAVIKDPLNLFGLRRATTQRKAHLCAQVLADESFSPRLRARAGELAQIRPRPKLVPLLKARTISTGLDVMAQVRRTSFVLGTVVFCAQR
jgi:methyltransferase (TIGR00027 family)